MKCAKCGKEITVADVPEYTTLEELKKDKEPKVYFLCAICRKPLEDHHEDLPFSELKRRIDELAAQNASAFVKFTCHHCEARQTSPDANTFYGKGYSCEECGRISYPSKFGFMVGFGFKI